MKKIQRNGQDTRQRLDQVTCVFESLVKNLNILNMEEVSCPVAPCQFANIDREKNVESGLESATSQQVNRKTTVL